MDFDPQKWLADTLSLSMESRGAWIDLISHMDSANPRGVLSGSLLFFTCLLRTTPDRARTVLNELAKSKTLDYKKDTVTHHVTLISRRMQREDRARIQGRNRQTLFRLEQECNGSGDGKAESKAEAKRKVNALALQIYNEYPRKSAKPVAIESISKQLKQYDFRMLLEKTKLYAKTIDETWSKDAQGGPGKRLIPMPSTWFNQERFLDDPKTWEGDIRRRPAQADITRTVADNKAGFMALFNPDMTDKEAWETVCANVGKWIPLASPEEACVIVRKVIPGFKIPTD